MEESKRPLADETPEEAILVSLDTGEFDVEISLDELEELARTAGGLFGSLNRFLCGLN